MQGNSFLGAFFRVSPFLKTFGISEEQFHKVVRKQYEKKFGRFGDAVVDLEHDRHDRGLLAACRKSRYGGRRRPRPLVDAQPAARARRANTPSSPRPAAARPGAAACRCRPRSLRAPPSRRWPSSTPSSAAAWATTSRPAPSPPSGVMGAGTGATQSKYVARRETPVYIAENCTQCMECITACPDTALPNMAQEVATVLKTAINNYVSDPAERRKFGAELAGLEQRARARMNEAVPRRESSPSRTSSARRWTPCRASPSKAKTELTGIIDMLPLAYGNVPAIFRSPRAEDARRRRPLLDLRLRPLQGMRRMRAGLRRPRRPAHDPRDRGAERRRSRPRRSSPGSCPTRPRSSSASTTTRTPAGSREAALRNHLMVRRNYEALVSGDGACAGCGEKSILRSVRERDRGLHAPDLPPEGRPAPRQGRPAREGRVRRSSPRSRPAATPSTSSTARPSPMSIVGLGGENAADTGPRIAAHEAAHGPITDQQICRRPGRRPAAGRLQPQGAPVGRRPPGQRHVGHDDGGEHRLQHGLRLHPPVQSAPLSLDEFALPGRRHDLLAHGRVGDPEPCPPVGRARAPGRRPARPLGGRLLRGGVLHAHAPGRRAHDRAGDPRAAEGLGDRRRRRPGRHRLPECLQGGPAEPART